METPYYPVIQVGESTYLATVYDATGATVTSFDNQAAFLAYYSANPGLFYPGGAVADIGSLRIAADGEYGSGDVHIRATASGQNIIGYQCQKKTDPVAFPPGGYVNVGLPVEMGDGTLDVVDPDYMSDGNRYPYRFVALPVNPDLPLIASAWADLQAIRFLTDITGIVAVDNGGTIEVTFTEAEGDGVLSYQLQKSETELGVYADVGAVVEAVQAGLGPKPYIVVDPAYTDGWYYRAVATPVYGPLPRTSATYQVLL